MVKATAKDENREIGCFLRAVREALGQTQQDFARSIGVEPNTYNQYEAGTRTLSPLVARTISRNWGISLDYLYLGDYRRLEHSLAEKVRVKISPPDAIDNMKVVPVPRRTG